ncbi:MAG: hypothetical protein ACYDG2_26805 [Ruminiclostridium sp.]
MKNNRKFVLAILVFTLVFSNISFAATVSAATQTNAVKAKVAGYIYNGLLKTKSNKYGVEISQKDGTKKYVVFDAKGQKLAKALVTKAKLKDGAEITVNGIIKKNVLQVISIVKKEQIAKKVETFTGWLGDSDCSPMLKNPTEMMTKCLTHTNCEASGYGISIKQADGTYKYYKFDANGHKLAKENIVEKTTSENVPEIVVKGSLEGNIIKVTSISVK